MYLVDKGCKKTENQSFKFNTHPTENVTSTFSPDTVIGTGLDFLAKTTKKLDGILTTVFRHSIIGNGKSLREGNLTKSVDLLQVPDQGLGCTSEQGDPGRPT